MLDFITEKQSVWELLKTTKRPIVLYGMGNGADKILDWCGANRVQVQGVFASDEFVRGQSFRGFKVESYDAVRQRLGEELCVVIAFASERPEVLERFAQLDREQRTVAPHLPLFDETESVSRCWLEKYAEPLQAVYDRLADEQSRRVFAAALNYKLSGKLGYLFDCTSLRRDDLRLLLQPSSREIYMDLGAYNGDTIRELGELTGWRWQRVIAAEPDRRSCRKLRLLAEELAQKGLPVEVHECGVWDCSAYLSFSDSGGRQSTFMGAGRRQVPVAAVDSLAAGRPVSYIKMDVEGAEMRALQGGRQTISRSRPKMLIAAYHYDNDIFRIPLLLWQLNPEYKIYLRKHPYVPAWELNFICIN